MQGPSSCKKAVFRDHYEFLRVIEHGGFGQVKLTHHRFTGTEVVVRVVRKVVQNLPVLSEPDMRRSLEHPNVIQLFQVVETQRNIYMMKHPGGGQLLNHVPAGGMQELGRQTFCPFMGPTVQELLRQIVLAMYCVPHHVPVEARRLIHQILTLDPRKWPAAKQILQHPWLTQGERYLPHRCTKALPKHSDPEIMVILFDMGYDSHKTWVSLAKKKFYMAMAM
ncbi:Sperm motility kinase [Sciurus carolinensis]|uniref:non-specific serine/threonine protein kinase n=1 Tax=Sciurus carolinensis TaxID=30640 RepID=A0AA41MNC1_SCICA|nr:Sperm motility kinase [Sciurus carolinensis]